MANPGFMDTSERGLRFMTDADFVVLAERVSAESSRREYLRDCKKEVDARIDAYEASVSHEAKDLKSLQPGATVGPGERIVVDKKTYKNVARAWLNPFKAGPVNFAAGWEEQQGGVA
jgi:hypothetical protein